MRITPSLALIGSFQFGISGPFDCHVYAIHGRGGAVVIDSGGGTHTDRLIENLRSDLGPATIKALIITHCHLDHCGGAASLRSLTGCRVIIPEVSRTVLENGDEKLSGLGSARERGIYPRDFQFSPCPVDKTVRDGEEFEAACIHFKAIQVRGHSHDAFCFLTLVEDQVWLFSGDALFYGGVLGVINTEDSGMNGYRSDLQKLAGLNIQGLFPGHGLFTLIDGQRHVDCAIEQARKGFIPRQIGQGDLIF